VLAQQHVLDRRPELQSLTPCGSPASMVYHTMNGPSGFTVTGTLKTWDIMDRLGEISVPTLLVGGGYDECRPAHLADKNRRIPARGSRSSRTRPISASPSGRRSSPRW
jgi:pimeloyl-ACP methyl ester carboxylesterase